MTNYILSFIGGAIVSWLVCWIIKKLARLDEWGDVEAGLKQPCIKPRYVKGGKSFYELASDFEFNEIEKIDAGFVFDGASIPGFFWQVLGSPFCANMLRSALIHDYRYRFIFRSNSLYDRQAKRDMCKVADYEFYNNLRKDGNRKIVAYFCFLAVRAYSTLKNAK